MVYRLFLADNHHIFRDGLRLLIANDDQFELVDDCEVGRDLAERVLAARPDVALIGVTALAPDVLERCEAILRTWAEAKLVLLAGQCGTLLREKIESAGLKGYVLKEDSYEDLRRVVLRVAQDGAGFHGKKEAGDDEWRSGRRRGGLISPKEEEVLRLIAEGLNTKEIAAELVVSTKTVETHRKRLMNKLGLHSIAELTKFAVAEGLTALKGLRR